MGPLIMLLTILLEYNILCNSKQIAVTNLAAVQFAPKNREMYCTLGMCEFCTLARCWDYKLLKVKHTEYCTRTLFL